MVSESVISTSNLFSILKCLEIFHVYLSMTKLRIDLEAGRLEFPLGNHVLNFRRLLKRVSAEVNRCDGCSLLPCYLAGSRDVRVLLLFVLYLW